MGMQSSRRKLSGGMSEPNARRKLKSIWAEKFPAVSLTRINKNFAAEYPMSLFALCEMWHRLRSKNQTMEVVIQAFAESYQRRAKEKHRLEEIILQQRAELKKRLAELDKLKTEKVS